MQYWKNPSMKLQVPGSVFGAGDGHNYTIGSILRYQGGGPEIVTTTHTNLNIFIFSLDHPDLLSLDERLDYLLTKIFDAKARLTETSLNNLIGHWP